jgi:hypothetical protein
MVLTVRPVSGGGGGTESVSDHPSPHASGAGGHATPGRVQTSNPFSFNSLVVTCGRGLVKTFSTSIAYLLSSCEMT